MHNFQLEKLQLKDILMVVDFCVWVEIDAFGPKIFESRNQNDLVNQLNNTVMNANK